MHKRDEKVDEIYQRSGKRDTSQTKRAAGRDEKVFVSDWAKNLFGSLKAGKTIRATSSARKLLLGGF